MNPANRMPSSVRALQANNPDLFEALCRGFRDSLGDTVSLGAARARARALEPVFTEDDAKWLCRHARKPAKPQDLAEAQSTHDRPAPGTAPVLDRRIEAQFALLEKSQRAGDLREVSRAVQALRQLVAMPRAAVVDVELDLSRLTDVEASCLEHLLELARGNRPRPGDAVRKGWEELLTTARANRLGHGT